MNQIEEKEREIVAQATGEADTSFEVSSVDPTEPAEAEAGSAVESSEAADESASAESAETPTVEEPEPLPEVASVTEPATEPPATLPEETTSALEETVEEPQAATTPPESEPQAEEPAKEEVPAKRKRKSRKSKKGPKVPLSELEAGAQMTGRVVGIADFGAFVDIGAETDGLIHISELSEGRVKKVSDVVSVGQEVEVWIKEVDPDQERISLSMKPRPKYRLRDLKPGMVVEGTVTGIRNYGVFVDIGAETEGLVHISEMADGYVDKPSELVRSGDTIEVRIKKVDRRRRRISLSMKGLGPSLPAPPPQQQEEPMPTAIELALRRALGEMEEEIEEVPELQVSVEETSRDELSEIFTRMLREYRASEEQEA